ncbi:SDR family oxidoreductase [Cupriavidus sp. AcVe19-1a]|uniref:SDR family oxidoreductase n=1 Tax=Cupriavidus sp. AcVe19-1a TaxID=2821359 RepID=UPI001AE93960|nr:SDR family oxidoreductase [Cupriavidus sp. AcVe19-1a]MBP0629528.1 SDR family oxidoreductase [Cupriavidus sp. AcVe19-1a]
MKRILVIGATSAIAEAAVRRFAERGDQLFLVGRNVGRLQVIAEDLRVRGSASVATRVMDANDASAHESMLDEAEAAMGGVDTVLICHGTLSDQRACEQSVSLAMAEIQTNALSVVALLTHIANRMEHRREGTIAVISSVAGERGRQSNYVYGSAKALVTAFMSGLRQRMAKCGVAVVTIKPGLVDTPMTNSFRKGPLWVQPEYVGKAIVRAIDAGVADAYVPGFWRTIMIVIRWLPDVVFRRLAF